MNWRTLARLSVCIPAIAAMSQVACGSHSTAAQNSAHAADTTVDTIGAIDGATVVSMFDQLATPGGQLSSPPPGSTDVYTLDLQPSTVAELNSKLGAQINNDPVTISLSQAAAQDIVSYLVEAEWGTFSGTAATTLSLPQSSANEVYLATGGPPSQPSCDPCAGAGQRQGTWSCLNFCAPFSGGDAPGQYTGPTCQNALTQFNDNCGSGCPVCEQLQ